MAHYLDTKALEIAKAHQISVYEQGEIQTEAGMLEIILCNVNTPSTKRFEVPFIQKQRFAEKIHYYWLCIRKGVAI